MEREIVSSSMISSLGHDGSASILEVEFKNGGAVWQYFDVPESTYYELRSASSIGKYFLANIKGQYSESRIS